MTRAPDCMGCRESRSQLFALMKRMNRARYGPKSAQFDKLAVLKQKIATCRDCAMQEAR